MATFVMLGCGRAKRSTPHPAIDLYTGSLYTKTLAHARRLGGPQWILSALYGVLEPDAVIEPYERTLDRAHDRRTWTTEVLEAMRMRTQPGDRVVVLAGAHYVEWCDALRRTGVDVDVPMRGMTIGQRMKWLADHERGSR